MAPLIVFRADASVALGSGHVARCAVLAEALAARGARILFLSRRLPGDMLDWLAAQGFEVAALAPEGDDLAACATALAERGNADWLVTDHYHIDAAWQRAMRPHAARILALDDLADRPLDCDLLLDPTLRPPTADPYRERLPPAAGRLLGPRYALLRAEFAHEREGLRERDGQVRRVLVCFGGTDPHNHTAAALEALLPQAARFERIDVVLGGGNPHREALRPLLDALPNAVLHAPARALGALMAAADLSLGAGGTMCWERAALGLPAIAVAIADNQVTLLGELAAAGCVLDGMPMLRPDPARFSRWLACALDSPLLLRGVAARSHALADGRGAGRVAARMLPRTLDFRPARDDDATWMLAWRNHPAIRASAHDPAAISLETHAAWLARRLAEPACRLWVAEAAGQPVGVVRFDLAPPQATISVYRDPTRLAERDGLIRQASVRLLAAEPAMDRIVAEIRSDNPASRAAFEQAGYRASHSVFILAKEAS